MSKTPFVDALVQESLPIWQQCLDSDFLRGLEAGTLDEDCFKGYIVDDSLYLREYARVFAWGMTKAQTMAAMRNYYSLLSFVNENEDVAQALRPDRRRHPEPAAAPCKPRLHRLHDRGHKER